MIKNIIFDFDGVLVDSEILVAKAFAKYMLNFGIEINEKEFAHFAGKKTFEVIEILSEKYSIKNQQKFFDDIMEIASNIYKKELTLVQGAHNFVSNANQKLFIGSNSIKNRILDGLYRVKLNQYFKADQVYSFDLVENPKPHPDIYLKAIEDNKKKAEESGNKLSQTINEEGNLVSISNTNTQIESIGEDATVEDVKAELFEGDNIVTSKGGDHGLSQITGA